jgi:hypothetical protein
MNKFEIWFLKRIFKKAVQQDYDHAARISGLYQMIRDAARAEFTEDNDPTLDSFLRECFDRNVTTPFTRHYETTIGRCTYTSGVEDGKPVIYQSTVGKTGSITYNLDYASELEFKRRAEFISIR